MKKPVLLYIDDDPNDMLLFEDACREAAPSFSLTTLNEGENVIQLLEKHLRREADPHLFPDVVLLDIKMPRLSGLEILQWIRSQPEFRVLPVVIFTSSRHEVDVRRAYELGANSYLVKSMDYNSLLKNVQLIDQYWFQWNQTVTPTPGLPPE